MINVPLNSRKKLFHGIGMDVEAGSRVYRTGLGLKNIGPGAKGFASFSQQIREIVERNKAESGDKKKRNFFIF